MPLLNSRRQKVRSKSSTRFESVKNSRTNVLVITGDPIGEKIAGPAIRAWNIANSLSASHNVRLITMSILQERDSVFELFQVSPGDDAQLSPHEQWADVILFQGHALAVFNVLKSSKKILISDLYDPMHLEQLEQSRKSSPSQWEKAVSDATAVINEQLFRADFFICASERQRVFWLGQLAAFNRINPLNYSEAPHLENLVAVVPFGLSSEPPRHTKNVLKGVIPGISANDKVIIWSGGLYNWFDPETLIQSISLLVSKHPEVKLFFQGTKHPHPGVPEMEIVSRSRELAADLQLIDKNVFFNDSWVDFDQRSNYLVEADLGVSTHHDHLETEFSFRTRILDYLWADLPIVVTKGDYFAEVVEKHVLGAVVDAEKPEELAKAIEMYLFDESAIAEAKGNISRLKVDFEWENCLKPLVSFVNNAKHSPDNEYLVNGKKMPTREYRVFKPRARIYGYLQTANATLNQDGFFALGQKIVKKAFSKMRNPSK